MRRILLFATAAMVLSLGTAARADAYLYWREINTIGRASLDATGANRSFLASVSGGSALAVDPRHVYWPAGDAIGRANIDGTGAAPDFIRGARNPQGVAVDDRYIYWTNWGTDSIGRAKLDGTGVEQRFITGLRHPLGLAVDDGHIYWGNEGTNSVGRANLDGSGAAETFISGVQAPYGLAAAGGYLYWTGWQHGIGRANADGSGVKHDFVATSRPGALAVQGGHIYWSGGLTNAIGRANLDGSGVIGNFVDGVRGVYALAADGRPMGVATPSTERIAFAGTQPLGTFGPPQPLTITNSGDAALKVERARVAAGDSDDFLIGHDDCSGDTIAIGASCTIRVRFGPSAGGPRAATLTVTSNDPMSPARIALEGTGGELPRGLPGESGPAGRAGSTGATGASGANGADGAGGPAGRAGEPGATAVAVPGPAPRFRLVTCIKRGRCSTRQVSGNAIVAGAGGARATLTRNGRRVASGSARGTRVVLKARRSLARGRYTLTLRYRTSTTRTPIEL